MLLTITTTMSPATDLGFLLHKHPDRVQSFTQAFGTAHVFYPDAEAARCTVALLLDVDPVKLVRTRRRGTPDFSLSQYVNDRPYAASSLLASAMAGVFRTAMRGRCDARPSLADSPLPLEITLPALPCRGGAERAVAYFEPLGWQVEATPVPLDPEFPEWGDSRYVSLRLTGEVRLADALNQLYVLLPVLDDSKHYWLAPDEVDKLIRAGEGWLAAHPDRAGITRRYLANRRGLVRAALGRLADADDAPEDALDRDPLDEEPPPLDPTAAEPGADLNTEPYAPPGALSSAAPDAATSVPADAEQGAESSVAGVGREGVAAAGEGAAGVPVALAERRIQAVLETLHAEEAPRVIDLGCGTGKLVARLKQDRYFQRIVGVDVSERALLIAHRRGLPDEYSPARLPRVEVLQGALTYADERFRGFDAAVLMEVIEHIDPPRLPAVERVVFGDARPRVVLVTTPNSEYNVRYEGLAEGAMRHPDHRFEWTRAEFQAWAARVAVAHGYRVRHVPVGDDDPEVGSPTQLGVFTR
ncbi:3' terminal RNA ribose 2'-O-methyltransferase Hen1 [Actinomadura barringtoniae]|uniref:Small RNA 2'-O-methyltransferase n=1 Tax=Actinomadura barringtoniae TaxID=1427535 RepID=A0A939TF49_9ACTN|nr:3' terminal RNA ribose 2'-O-methyltransferase Hen1 [Actinomadura barringtoniae]MBO2454000.1 3' terminal RNA ribose 2'-O-methyltransferase Hen1 [Actinomadura barringtoniae]